MGVGFTDVWGPLERNVSEERTYARYRGLLSDGALGQANVRHGQSLFQRTCAACHKMYGEGGTIGPDITGSNRANLDYLLFNVLDPNGEVPEAYRMVVVTTRDGRTLSGRVVVRNGQASHAAGRRARRRRSSPRPTSSRARPRPCR